MVRYRTFQLRLPLQAFRDARDSKGVEEARADPEAEIAAIQTLLDRIREPPKAEVERAASVKIKWKIKCS